MLVDVNHIPSMETRVQGALASATDADNASWMQDLGTP